MMTKTKEPAARPETEDPAADLLDAVEFEPTAETIRDKQVPNAIREMPDEPVIHDPAWTPYVLSFLTPEEQVKGRPKVPGLRRLVSMLLGDIVENVCEVVQAPNPANGYIATVQTKLVILWTKDVGENGAMLRTFTGLADVYAGNTDAAFARFPSPTAETRSEGRAIKKALMLQVTTAEEMTDVSVDDNCLNGEITPTQINFIDLKCKQNDIDVLKFIASYRGRYGGIKKVPSDIAGTMIKHLSDLQQDRKRIPERIKGYDPKWSSEE